MSCPLPPAALRARSIEITRAHEVPVEIMGRYEMPEPFELTIELSEVPTVLVTMIRLASIEERLSFAQWLAARGMGPMAACDLADAVAQGRWPR